MRDLNDLTRPTVPSGAIQERMAAETEERRGVVGPAPALPDDAGAPTALRAALADEAVSHRGQVVGRQDADLGDAEGRKRPACNAGH